MNNNLLFNAALAGFLESVEGGRSFTSATSGDYASVVNAGVTFATAVDALVPTDGSISAGGGAALATAASDNVAISKCAAMRSAAAAAFQGKATLSTNAPDYTLIANACVALYTRAIGAMLIP